MLPCNYFVLGSKVLNVCCKVDVGEELDEEGEPIKPTPKTPANTTSASAPKPPPSTSSAKETASTISSASVTLDVRAKFGSNLFLLSGSELGWVFTELELKCPQVLESWGESKIEINVDAIPSDIFARLQKYVNDLVEDINHTQDSPDAGGPRKKKRKST